MLPRTNRQIKRETETPPPGVLMLEQHFSIEQIAERWSMSHNTVLEKFQDEPGVVKSAAKKGIFRVPLSVMERVYARMLQQAEGRR